MVRAEKKIDVLPLYSICVMLQSHWNIL